jgi:hypothetical protein
LLCAFAHRFDSAVGGGKMHWYTRPNLIKLSVFLSWLAGLMLAPQLGAQSSTNVVVAFSTTNPTPLNLGFAGFTTELLGTGVEYGDTNMQQVAAKLSPGWLLYPAGTTGDAFNWATGLTDSNWVNVIGLKEGPNNNASNRIGTP